MLRTINATRYVTPFREGGSLPALVEADDLGLYVLKFHGAGQGPLALWPPRSSPAKSGARWGCKVPELVLMEVDAALGRNEPDYEIRELLRASVGLNLGGRFSARVGDVRPCGGRPRGRRSGIRRRLVRCLRDEYRPHGAQSESALLAQIDLLHRPWSRALFPSRLERYRAKGPLAIPGHSRPRAVAVGCPYRGGRPRACAPCSAAMFSPRCSPRCRTAGCYRNRGSRRRPPSVPRTSITSAAGWMPHRNS